MGIAAALIVRGRNQHEMADQAPPDGGKADLIRRRDTYEDLIANDVW